MAIENISFKKGLFKKTDKNTKNTKVQIPEQLDKKESKTISNSTKLPLAAYLAAAMMLAGSVATTSCVQQEQETIVDTSELVAVMSQLMKIQNESLELQKQMIEYLKNNKDQNQELINLLNKVYQQNQQISSILTGIAGDVSQIASAVLRISVMMEEANKNDAEFLAKIDKIIEGQQSDNEKLTALIELNAEQNKWLTNILGVVEALKEGNEDLSDTILKFYKDYQTNSDDFKETDKDHTLLMNKIYEALLSSNDISAETLAEIKKIQQSNKTDSEKLDAIINILNQINQNISTISETISKISAQIDELGGKLDANHKETLDVLSTMNNGLGTISGKLDKIVANQETANEYFAEISVKIDKINGNIGQIGSSNITIDQLREMLGPLFNQISGELTIIQGNQISKDELTAILEQYKTDLTKTNGLIENLTSVVKNLNLTSGMSEDLQKVVDAIKEFKEQQGTHNTSELEAYSKIMQEIAKLNNGMEAIAKTANEVGANLAAFKADFSTYGTKMIDYMKDVINGQASSKASMEAYGDMTVEALNKAEQQRAAQIALLQAIVDKETDGNGGGLTQAELEESLSKLNINFPDYSAILAEIKDALGKVITSDDLQNFFIKTQPDLTKTNALIENLTSVLKSKDFTLSGDVSVNVAEVENLLNKINNQIANQQVPSKDQLTTIIELVNQIAQSSQPETTTKATTKSSSETDDFYALINKLSIEAAKAQGKGATYYVDPSMFSLNA